MAQASGLQQIVVALARLIDNPKGVLKIGTEQAHIRMGLIDNPGEYIGSLISAQKTGSATIREVKAGDPSLCIALATGAHECFGYLKQTGNRCGTVAALTQVHNQGAFLFPRIAGRRQEGIDRT